jgi:hypothetical protein
MKKSTTQIQFTLIFCLGLALIIPQITLTATPPDSTAIQKSEQANYNIARYVTASGGVIGARSQNYVQHGTAGQAIVSGAQSANNFLASGFWIQPGAPTEISPAEGPSLPTVFALHQNYPNPFNPETIIEFDLPNTCLVTVEIFNTVGQRIRLISSQVEAAGHVTAVWDGRNEQGEVMGSGVYFYRVTADAVDNTPQNHQIQFQQTKKMLLVK